MIFIFKDVKFPAFQPLRYTKQTLSESLQNEG